MKVIVVDGIIGAGKTTYINILNKKLTERGYTVSIVREPVDKWVDCGILQRFYNDPKRWGYHFQTKAFHDRVVENIRVFNENPDSDFYILERSPFTDTLFIEMLHSSGDIDDLELQHYREWWNLWNKVMPYSPDYFLYLKPDVEVCMDRLRMRNRDGETGVGKDYQEALEKKHDSFFEDGFVNVGSNKDANVINIFTNEDFKDNEEIQERLIEEFLRNVSSSDIQN